MPAGRVTPDPTRLARAYARMRRDVAGVRTIAVTGTKGKTSTTEFIGQLLQAAGLRTAVSTTESARIGARTLDPVRAPRGLRGLRGLHAAAPGSSAWWSSCAPRP